MLFFQIIAKHETPRPQYVPDFLLAYILNNIPKFFIKKKKKQYSKVGALLEPGQNFPFFFSIHNKIHTMTGISAILA